ncbi:unnamed protein product [Umbelopsis ramanniana]
MGSIAATTAIPRAIKRVAVIGAGIGGLISAKSLKDEGYFDSIKVFERNPKSGGTWIYTSNYGIDTPIPNTVPQHGPPQDPSKVPASAIYSNLHTNLPIDVMCLRNRPFIESTPEFPGHESVLDYIRRFEKDENLMDLVQYNTNVIDAEYKDNEWLITYFNITTGKSSVDAFDALIVSNGHYYDPFIPDIDGLKRYKELEKEKNNGIKIIHSREYREPQEFIGKNVLVVGNSASANDVAREALTTATKVYQSVRASSLPPLDPNSVTQVSKVSEIGEFLHDGQKGSIKLKDGSHLTDVDCIVFATGYLFSLPFLSRSEGGKLITDGQRVHNLYRHLFYINNPTLAFIGLPIRIVPFPISQSQSKVISRCWSGKTKLPTRQEMDHWHNMQPRPERPRDDFVFGAEKEFQYMDRLNMWAEGHHPDDDVDNWSSTDPETGEIPSRYKDRRTKALDLRRAALGY